MLLGGLYCEMLSHDVKPTARECVAPAGQARAYRVRALERALSILNVLAASGSELRVAANDLVQAQYGHTL